jgi:hypothetical protein
MIRRKRLRYIDGELVVLFDRQHGKAGGRSTQPEGGPAQAEPNKTGKESKRKGGMPAMRTRTIAIEIETALAHARMSPCGLSRFCLCCGQRTERENVSEDERERERNRHRNPTKAKE